MGAITKWGQGRVRAAARSRMGMGRERPLECVPYKEQAGEAVNVGRKKIAGGVAACDREPRASSCWAVNFDNRLVAWQWQWSGGGGAGEARTGLVLCCAEIVGGVSYGAAGWVSRR